MPGRGQYWKKGGLIDETVKEEDLSQALHNNSRIVKLPDHFLRNLGSVR